MKEEQYDSAKSNSTTHKLDKNRDGIVSDRELENAQNIADFEHTLEMRDNINKREDAQRNMAWFALFGMLLYPFSVLLADWINLSDASHTLGSMAPTYFVSVAAIVAAFYGKEAYIKTKEIDKERFNKH